MGTARYYDYDYDNNRIIMFDADEIEASLAMLDLEADPSHQQSQSTETVPDDPILGASSNPNDSNKIDESKSSPSVETTDEKIQEDKEDQGGVMWISSESPKGSRHIPYALQFTHSYAINKLEVTLTQLVDTKTVQRQKQQKQQAQQQQAMALRAKWMQQQQLRYKHAAHGQDPRYAHPQPHPHYRAPYPASPPHAQDPRYAHYRVHPNHPAAYGRQQAPPVSGSRKEPSAGSPSQSPYRVHPNYPGHAYHGHQQPAVDAAGAATQN